MEEAAQVRELLCDNGLVTWSVGSPIGKIPVDGDFEAHKDVLRHTLELANILGAANIRMFSFYIPQGKDPENYRQQVLEQMGQMLEISRHSGIVLCHENEKGIYGDTADRCRFLYQTFPELKGVFDPANFVQCDQDTLEAWEMLGKYVKYMHIKDCAKDGMVVPPGEGVGRLPELLTRYAKLGGGAGEEHAFVAMSEFFHKQTRRCRTDALYIAR